MVRRIPHCDSRQLELALANQLSDVQSETLSQHLTSCPHCRSELEQLAGEPAWWDDAKAYLSSSEELVAIDDDGRRAPVPADDDLQDEVSLDFLAPSARPGMLGRLGGYEVERVIGRGGMGIVLLGEDPALQRRVAIKILAGHLALSAAARKRFAREARAAAAVVHDHVIPIHSVDTSGSIPFLVMPHIAGRSLQDRLDASGVLETKEVLRIAMQTAQGLAAAHAQGLVHRDIKPANILLENGVERVRITDFGLARAIDDASQTQSGFIAGTPQYMAPEQARGEPIDARADLFSLGSVMYAMCSGHPPFRAETTLAVLRRICDDPPRDLREANPDVPAWLAEIVHKLLAKSPEERFQTASEVASLLERWLAHLQQPTMIPPPFVPLVAPAKQIAKPRWRIAAWIAGSLIVLATVAIVVAALFVPPGSLIVSFQPQDQDPLSTATTPAPAPTNGPMPTAMIAPTESSGMPPDELQAEIDAVARQTSALESQIPRGSPSDAATLAFELQQIDREISALEEELRSLPRMPSSSSARAR